MQQIALEEAQARLAELVRLAANGEEVVITSEDGSGFKITPVQCAKPAPKFGSAKGLIRVSDDFDAPLDGFEDYTP